MCFQVDEDVFLISRFAYLRVFSCRELSFLDHHKKSEVERFISCHNKTEIGWNILTFVCNKKRFCLYFTFDMCISDYNESLYFINIL